MSGLKKSRAIRIDWHERYKSLEGYKNLLANRLHEISRALGFRGHQPDGHTIATQREVLREIRELQQAVKVLVDEREEATARICEFTD